MESSWVSEIPELSPELVAIASKETSEDKADKFAVQQLIMNC